MTFTPSRRSIPDPALATLELPVASNPMKLPAMESQQDGASIRTPASAFPEMTLRSGGRWLPTKLLEPVRRTPWPPFPWASVPSELSPIQLEESVQASASIQTPSEENRLTVNPLRREPSALLSKRTPTEAAGSPEPSSSMSGVPLYLVCVVASIAVLL